MKISGNYCRRIKSWVEKKISEHKAVSSAHHTKYTDAEAIAAILADDKYVQNTGDVITGDMIARNAYFIGENIVDTASLYPQWYSRKARGVTTPIASGDIMGQFRFYGKNTVGNWVYGARLSFSVYGTIGNSYLDSKMMLFLYHTGGFNYIEMFSTPWHVNLHDLVLKNPKNHTHSALSGVKKIIEIDINGVPYYYEVYPTKA